MVYSGVAVNCLRLAFILISRIHALLSHVPTIFPRCWCLGDRKMLQESWSLVQDDVRVLLVGAESKSMELSSTNLGSKRSFTVAETILRADLCGPQLALKSQRW